MVPDSAGTVTRRGAFIGVGVSTAEPPVPESTDGAFIGEGVAAIGPESVLIPSMGEAAASSAP